MAMRAPRKGDLDRIGPFHAYLVYAAIVLLDLAGLAIIVLLLIGAIDWIENLF
jgi:hypothetical protein